MSRYEAKISFEAQDDEAAGVVLDVIRRKLSEGAVRLDPLKTAYTLSTERRVMTRRELSVADAFTPPDPFSRKV